MVETVSVNILFPSFLSRTTYYVLTIVDVTSVCYKTHKPQVHISIKHWAKKTRLVYSVFSVVLKTIRGVLHVAWFKND